MEESTTKRVAEKSSSSSSSSPSSSTAHGKRRNQVPRACSNCRKTHAACDTQRPCKRCTQHGLATSCVDIPRKKRISKKVKLEVEPPSGWTKEENINSAAFVGSSTSNQTFSPPSSPSSSSSSLTISSSNEGVTSPTSKSGSMWSLSSQAPGAHSSFGELGYSSYPSPDKEFDQLMTEVAKLEEGNKKLESQLAGVEKELSILKGVHKSLLWLRTKHLQHNMAVSVWKGTPNNTNNHLLIECNRSFMELVGYSEQELKNFTSDKLIKSTEDPSSSGSSPSPLSSFPTTKRIQISAAKGRKDVFASINPFQDMQSQQYIIIQMIEAST